MIVGYARTIDQAAGRGWRPRDPGSKPVAPLGVAATKHEEITSTTTWRIGQDRCRLTVSAGGGSK
jgi:hypothetical protein